MGLQHEHACLQVDPKGAGHAALFGACGWDVRVHYMGFTVLALAPLLPFRTRLDTSFQLGI